MIELIHNVKVVVAGKTHRIRAGVYESLPQGVEAALRASRLVRPAPIPFSDQMEPEAVQEPTAPAVEPEPTEPTEPTEPGGAFDDMKVSDLKEIAKSLEINGYSNMAKADLIQAIEALQ